MRETVKGEKEREKEEERLYLEGGAAPLTGGNRLDGGNTPLTCGSVQLTNIGSAPANTEREAAGGRRLTAVMWRRTDTEARLCKLRVGSGRVGFTSTVRSPHCDCLVATPRSVRMTEVFTIRCLCTCLKPVPQSQMMDRPDKPMNRTVEPVRTSC